MRAKVNYLFSIFSSFIGFLILFSPAQAYGGDLSISKSSVRFSEKVFMEGSSVRIYATIYNSSTNDLLGTVKFYDKTAGRQIGSDQTISLFANKTDDVFIDWTPWFPGNHTITATIDPWIAECDDPSNNTVEKTITVLKDTDHDGIQDDKDPDDDNDKIPDTEDAFPLDASEWQDTDGDRIGDNADEDDDNDGIKDTEDAFPLDSRESEDTDNDGTGNNEDPDDDNDGLSDEEEKKIGTDPNNPDTDNDTVNDSEDKFPLDQSEQYDFDNDEIGDNKDDDDDNDGIPDTEDLNDHNKGPLIVLENEYETAFLNRLLVLDASASTDPDGEVKEIQWIIDEKEAKTGNKTGHTFNTTGQHSIKVIAIDDKNESREKIYYLNVFNLDLYLQSVLIAIIIILAIVIIIKYSSQAKK